METFEGSALAQTGDLPNWSAYGPRPAKPLRDNAKLMNILHREVGEKKQKAISSSLKESALAAWWSLLRVRLYTRKSVIIPASYCMLMQPI
jgi:hypothetical protein